MIRGSKSARGIRSNIRTYKFKSNVSGMAQNRAETFLRPDQAVDIINMHATEEGAWSADNAGYTNFSTSPYESGAAIDGIAAFTDSAQGQHLFVTCNGKLISVNLTTSVGTVVDTGFTAGEKTDFMAMQDALFTVDGTIATPRKLTYNGTYTASDSAGWPISDGLNNYTTPHYAERFQNRAAYANFLDNSSHITLSAYGDPENFEIDNTPDGAYIAEVGGRDGQPITGMRVIHIPASNRSQLVIFKTESIYVLTGNSSYAGDADFFRIVELNTAPDGAGGYSALNNRVIVQVGNDLLALNRFGITSFSTSNQSGTLQPLGIESDLVKDVIGRMNLGATDQAWGIHLPHRREVIWWIPTGSSTVANEAIVYKYPSPGSRNEIPKWSRRTGLTMAHGCLFGTVFYGASYGGKVLKVFTASNYNGSGIPWMYRYAYWDVGNERQNKRYSSGNALFRVRSPQTFTMSYEWKDGGSNDKGSSSYAIGTTTLGAVYGTGVYGTAYYGEKEEVSVQYDILGDGLRVRHTLSGTTNETGPEFLGLNMVMELGNISQSYN